MALDTSALPPSRSNSTITKNNLRSDVNQFTSKIKQIINELGANPSTEGYATLQQLVEDVLSRLAAAEEDIAEFLASPVVYTGWEIPSGILGKDGDIYMNTNASLIYVKSNGDWGAPTSYRGNDGNGEGPGGGGVINEVQDAVATDITSPTLRFGNGLYAYKQTFEDESSLTIVELADPLRADPLNLFGYVQENLMWFFAPYIPWAVTYRLRQNNDGSTSSPITISPTERSYALDLTGSSSNSRGMQLSIQLEEDGPWSEWGPVLTLRRGLPNPPPGVVVTRVDDDTWQFDVTGTNANTLRIRYYVDGLLRGQWTVGSASPFTVADDGQEHEVTASAVNSAGESAQSIPTTYGGTLPAPSNVRVSYTGDFPNYVYTLVAEPVAGATGYRFYQNGLLLGQSASPSRYLSTGIMSEETAQEYSISAYATNVGESSQTSATGLEAA